MKKKVAVAKKLGTRITELAPSSFFKNSRAIMTDITFGFCGFTVHLQTSVHVSYFFVISHFPITKIPPKCSWPLLVKIYLLSCSRISLL